MSPNGNPLVGVSDCGILRLSRLWNITYHDCENNHDYKILTIFDEKLMQQVMFDKYNVFYGLYALDNYILPSSSIQCDVVCI